MTALCALCTRCRAEPRHTGSELGERCLWPTPEERYAVAVALGMISQDGIDADSDGGIRLNRVRQGAGQEEHVTVTILPTKLASPS